MRESYEDYSKRARTKTIYLLNTFEDIAMRCEPDGRYFAKPHGLDEYQIAYNTDLVCETVNERTEITRKEYDAYWQNVIGVPSAFAGQWL